MLETEAERQAFRAIPSCGLARCDSKPPTPWFKPGYGDHESYPMSLTCPGCHQEPPPRAPGEPPFSVYLDPCPHCGLPPLTFPPRTTVPPPLPSVLASQLPWTPVVSVPTPSPVTTVVAPVVPPEPDLVLVDIETTGRSREWHAIVELAAARMSPDLSEVRSHFSCLVQPHEGYRWEQDALDIHGLDPSTAWFRSQAVPLGQALSRLWGLLLDPPVRFVSHNASFDAGFLTVAAGRCGLPVLEPLRERKPECTLKLARDLKRRGAPFDHGCSLSALAIGFGVKQERAHRALSDVRTLVRVYRRLRALDAELPPLEAASPKASAKGSPKAVGDVIDLDARRPAPPPAQGRLSL